jgi:apolipoprotein D and lipocalin family protein
MSTAPTTPLPASLLRAESRKAGLDDRILQAEQRLIAREENLRRRVGAIGTRLRETLQPKRLLAPVAGGVLALAGLWWVGRRRGDAPESQASGPRAADAAQGSSSPGGAWSGRVPWVQLLGFAFPLLPAAWRARVNPATVNTVMTVGLPLIERLFARSSMPPPLTMGPVSSARLAGTWYEIARMPGLRRARGEGQPLVRHRLRGDGGIDIEHEHLAADGSVVLGHGQALAVRGSGGAQWKVSRWSSGLHWMPLAWHEEWVLHIDDATGELMLGSPGRDVLRLLSRRPGLTAVRLHTLVEIARDQGYEVERLQFVDR